MNDKIINPKDLQEKVLAKGKYLTDFLTPLEIKNLFSFFNFSQEISSIAYTYPNYELERSKLLLCKNSYEEIDYSNFESLFNISIIKIIPNKFSKQLMHKDYLGTLIGLGIKREKIGDILICKNNFSYIFVSKDICDYIIENLKRIGHETVKVVSVSSIPKNDLEELADNHKELEIQITSYRLDNLIAHGFNLSRSTVTNLLESENVKVNYENCINSLYQINENDLISIKGYGRIKIVKLNGESKKGKKRVIIYLYTKIK